MSITTTKCKLTINKSEIQKAQPYIDAAKQLAETMKFGGTASATKNQGIVHAVYKKTAEIITSSFFNLGVDNCAYVISKFPQKLRDPVVNMLKKETEEFERNEKELVGGAAAAAGEVCARVKKDECNKKSKECLWKNSKCISKEAIESWQRAKFYTTQLIPEINLDDFKYREEGFVGATKACTGFIFKLARLGLVCGFVNFYRWQSVIFVGANLAYDFATHIVNRLMHPNAKPKYIVDEYADLAADNVINYLQPTVDMTSNKMASNKMASTKMASTKMASNKMASTKRAYSKKAYSKKSSTAKVSFATPRASRSKSLKIIG
jgi:hypothetical protein